MPFWQESDTFHDDPRWAALAGGHSVTVDQLQAGYVRLMSSSARHMSSGWLTRETAQSLCRPLVLERLSTKVLPDMAPLLHTRGDECSCFEAWLDGYEYVIHWFLKRNPAKRETERHRAQKREREDPRVRAQVYDRDGGCCRYCRSGPMKKAGMGRAKDRRRIIHYDHVDPDALAGDDLSNLVVSCARCNDEKGARTPFEADMVLLPVPTEVEKREWYAREEPARFDRPDTTPDSAQTAPQTADRTAVPTAVETAVPTPVPGAVVSGEVRPGAADDGQRHPDGLSAEGAGSGRGGPPGAVVVTNDLGQPARPSDAPDIYTGRSRSGRPAGGDE